MADLLTPVTFCEMYPPDHFPLLFYRLPIAPDLVIRPGELDLAAIADADIFWATVTGLSAEPSRSAHHAAWAARAAASSLPQLATTATGGAESRRENFSRSSSPVPSPTWYSVSTRSAFRSWQRE